MIKRIFHPIGQGAFYSERHDSFNIVYDCGNWRNTSLSDKVVRQSFSKDDVIDILFISHFDYDHISKIPTLKDSVREIKRVILPLLEKEEQILLSNIYSIINYEIIGLISNPQQFFGENTKIISINSVENNETIIQESIEPTNIDDLIDDQINSGRSFTLGNNRDWVFIPYNHEYKNRHEVLIDKLEKDGFDVERLKNDKDYAIENICSNEKRKKM